MQEVIKRMQERQEKTNEPKLPDRVTLVIAKWQGKNYPVILPKLSNIKSGDYVWFQPEGAVVCGDVMYVEDYCDPDGSVWTLATIATEREPIKAIRVAYSTDLRWEEEES